MVGLERAVLPLIGSQNFRLTSSAAVLSFIVAFGFAKAFTNLAAGRSRSALGRRRLLIAGWAAALPVPLLIEVAPSWAWVVAANVFLGINQGLAWSMTVVMKIDLVGPKRRGLALGLNEAAGYGGVAIAAGLSGLLASQFAAARRARRRRCRDRRDRAAALGPVRARHGRARRARAARHADGRRQAAASARGVRRASYRVPALRSCSQAGLVNNLNDALAWGLVPLFLAAHGASVAQVGLVAAVYPARLGRRPDRDRRTGQTRSAASR